MQGLDRTHHTIHVQPLYTVVPHGAPCNGRHRFLLLRIYGFTPLLPLCRRDPETRISESKRRRQRWGQRYSSWLREIGGQLLRLSRVAQSVHVAAFRLPELTRLNLFNLT